ncbi:MAG: ATP-binding cassette domain-containing protein [Deltaproteobacteria bacterium]|nr:ATP-binding cassette domain-containing protein [Deltaproteobacteria bacterium]
MIQCKNLTRKYGNFTAVDNISFEIPKGQIVGLLGHNGAGKTTTLKMLTGFLEPTEGLVIIDGLSMETDRLTIQKNMGYLPETSPLYPEMTVLEYLHYAADLHKVNANEKITFVKDSIQKTNLKDKAHCVIDTLSKGYKQRVAVAQAILHNPKILVLDEPTNGLDPSQIFEMRALIKDLAKNATVILSTHILQEVEAVCDRVIIVNQGRIAKDGLLKNLQKTNALTFSIKADPLLVTSELSQLEGVTSVECLNQTESFHSFRLELNTDWKAVSPAIAQHASGKGWPLYELKQEHVNIERFFQGMNQDASV